MHNTTKDESDKSQYEASWQELERREVKYENSCVVCGEESEFEIEGQPYCSFHADLINLERD